MELDPVMVKFAKMLDRQSRKESKLWDKRLSSMTEVLESRMDHKIKEQDERWDRRISSLKADILKEVDAKIVAASSYAGSAAAPSVLSARSDGTARAIAAALVADRPKWTCTEIEIRGFIDDWNNLLVEGLSKTEAMAYVEELMKHLPAAVKKHIDLEETEGCNNGPLTALIGLRVQPGTAVLIRKAVAQLLPQKESLRIRDKILKASTEPSPEQRPTRAAGGKAKSTLIKMGATPDEIRSDYKIPKLTTFVEKPGQRPVPVLTWSADEAFKLCEPGLQLSGLMGASEDLLSRLNSSAQQQRS